MAGGLEIGAKQVPGSHLFHDPSKKKREIRPLSK